LINFNSTNLEYIINKVDDIDVLPYIDANVLNYLFSTYLYYRYNTTLKDG